MTIPDPEITEYVDQTVLFYISLERIEQLNRSPVAIIAARRGPSCPSLLQAVHELSDAKKLITEIARHCADEPGYIRHDMPIQEIVFRMLLLRDNKPTDAEELHHDLTEVWASPTRPISISLVGLIRVLDNDTYYGFTRLESED